MDIDPEEAAQAKKTGIYKAVHTCSAQAIPEKDSTFDFVFSNSVLEHIENIKAVIKEAARVLKGNGIFMFVVPSNTFYDCLRGPIWPGVSRQGYIQKLDARLAVLRYWNLQEWEKALVEAGFTVESATYCFNKSEVVRWETISRFTAGILVALFGGKKHPIEIQRQLGIRKAAIKIPRLLAAVLALLLTIGISKTDSGLYGDLMVVARKK